MKRLGIITCLSAALLFISLPSNGQTDSSKNQSLNITSSPSNTYRTAIGLRAGGTSGITFKRLTENNNAYKGLLGIWHDGFSVTLLGEKYVNANVPGLNWYYGLGGHLAVETRESFYRGYEDSYRDFRRDDIGLGIDGIIGIEYKIPPIPFAISLDFKPFVEISTEGNTFIALDPGLGIKVAF